MEQTYKILVGKSQVSSPLGDQSGLDSNGSELSLMTGSREHGNETNFP